MHHGNVQEWNGMDPEGRGTRTGQGVKAGRRRKDKGTTSANSNPAVATEVAVSISTETMLLAGAYPTITNPFGPSFGSLFWSW